MAIRKLTDGSPKPWLCDLYIDVGGTPKRKRKKFATKGEALAFERFIVDPSATPWIEQNIPADEAPGEQRRLSDLVERWFGLHGQSLKDGASRKSKLLLLCNALGNPYADQFTSAAFAQYREARLSGAIADRRAVATEDKGVSTNTVNREHAYLRAVFNELKRMGEWTLPNPLDTVRAYKVDDRALAFLYADEIDRLLDACRDSDNPDLLMVVKLCLATGARWSEVEQITQSQVTPYRLTFTRTKSSKSRTVPISPELFGEIPRRRGRLFRDCYRAFEKAVVAAGIQLPAGQNTHVLRHTFASHFMQRGGSILVLQQILGHSTITMTMRYAHMAPNHLDDAVRLNPLAR